ncbi:hypothetical protein LB504_001960 [Fusarium proliferatum]|nr:hypothetical protein LB504_001960 [Fusarium proliferatum]
MYRDGARNTRARSSRDMPPLSVPKKRKPKVPTQPSRFIACPVEIQLQVLESVPKPGLVALSRVNKHLASIVQPILHREVDVNCPPLTLRCRSVPLVLVLRTLLWRPDLAQAVQHLRFDGYDFVERELNELPTTPLFDLTDEDKLKAVQFIKALDLYQGIDWAHAFLKGQVDSLVSLVVALTPNVRSLYLGEFFSVEICYLRLLLKPESYNNPGGSNVHKFEHLRHVTVDNHCATYHHIQFGFNNIYQSFFHLRMLENLSISGSFPEASRPFTITTKLEHLRCLNLKRISEAELGRILSIAPNLEDLKYTYACYPKADHFSNHSWRLDVARLSDSLEGHRLKLKSLQLLVVDNINVLDEGLDPLWPLALQGTPLKLHDFSNLRILTVPWILIAGPSKGERPSPLRYLIPKCVERLTLTDDLYQQPYWGWSGKEIQALLEEYLCDVKETKLALDAMLLVGPILSKMYKNGKFHSARQLARSASVDLKAVEMTIPESDVLRSAEERARRYGQLRQPARAQFFDLSHIL